VSKQIESRVQHEDIPGRASGQERSRTRAMTYVGSFFFLAPEGAAALHWKELGPNKEEEARAYQETGLGCR
jgi:hypothetical protein